MKLPQTSSKQIALLVFFSILVLSNNRVYSQIYRNNQANQIIRGSRKVNKDQRNNTVKYLSNENMHL